MPPAFTPGRTATKTAMGPGYRAALLIAVGGREERRGHHRPGPHRQRGITRPADRRQGRRSDDAQPDLGVTVRLRHDGVADVFVQRHQSCRPEHDLETASASVWPLSKATGSPPAPGLMASTGTDCPSRLALSKLDAGPSAPHRDPGREVRKSVFRSPAEFLGGREASQQRRSPSSIRYSGWLERPGR